VKININLRFKITIAILGLWALTIISGASMILKQNEVIFAQKYHTRLKQLLHNNSKAMREALLNKDDLQLNYAVSFLHTELEPIEVMAIDSRIKRIVANSNFFHLGRLAESSVYERINKNQQDLITFEWCDTLYYAYPIRIGEYKIGDLVMLTSRGKEARLLDKDLRPTINSILQVSLFTFLIGILGVFLLTKQILKPLDFISQGIRRISRGDHSFRINMKTSDEFEQVAYTLNSMLDRIENNEQKITSMNIDLEKKIELAVKHSVDLEKQIQESERMASVGRLAGSIAHELNNPLASILMYARLIQEKAKNKLVKDNLEKILRNTVRARNTIKDLVDYTRHSKIERKPVHLSELIINCAQTYRKEIEERQIDFRVESSLKNDFVLLDAFHFERVFNNLTQNAIDAMPDGGTLLFKISEKIKYVWIKIIDSGSGIVAEDLNKIFEPFYSTKENGTGLGLFLSYEIIRSHQGQISVQSKPMEGTTFIIKLRREI